MQTVVKEDAAFAMLKARLFPTASKLTDVIPTMYANADFKMIPGRVSA